MIQTKNKPKLYEEATQLLKIFLVLGEAKYPATKASATVVANSEDEVFDMVKIYEVQEIKFLGYAHPTFKEPKVLYENDGEFINEHTNN